MPFKASSVPGPTSWYWIFVTRGTGMQGIQALRTGAHATSGDIRAPQIAAVTDTTAQYLNLLKQAKGVED